MKPGDKEGDCRVSEKIGRRYSLSVGVRAGAVWRKMEITDYLCFSGKTGATVQRNSQRDGKYYRRCTGINIEGAHHIANDLPKIIR